MFSFKSTKNTEKNQEKTELIKQIKYNIKSKIYFIPKLNYNSIIPLHVYTCWHTKELPPLMNKNFQKLISDNPRLTFHLYDEDDCREFIGKHFKPDVLVAYNSLIPCSYKSDLWRFCVLFINGGIYLDIKFECFNNFKLISLTEREYFVRDIDYPGILTGLIISKPCNPILYYCIRQIVNNVNNKYYGLNPLYPTGPCLLGSYFTREQREKLEIYFDTSYYNGKKIYYITYNDGTKDVIILKIYHEYRDEQKIYQKKPYYADLWRQKNIYT